MTEAFKACFEKLEALTTQELDRSVTKLVQVENRNVALVIAHLAELSRRKGDLKLGYPNLFVYCVKKLGLSEGSVALRIQVANVARRFPQVLAALAEGRISLSVAGRLAPHLGEENVETLLSDCAGMTKSAVEQYLVRLKPQPTFEPSIRKLPTERERPTPRAESEERTSRAEKENCAHPSPGERSAPVPVPLPLPSPPPATPPGRIIPATTGMSNFRFPASTDFRKKLERLAEVMGIKNLEKHMATVLERAVDLALEAKDPKRRLVRREARARRRDAALRSRNAADESCPDKMANGSCSPVESVAKQPENQPRAAPEGVTSTPARSRHVPIAVRDRVLERAGHRCQFTGPDGTRCTARTGLEIEHMKPFAIFQSHDESLLEALCSSHNRLRAEQAYGAKHIRQKIEERKRACVPSAQCASS